MSVQVLVASMFQKDFELPKRMNLCSDAVIGNQCDKDSIDEIEYKNFKIKYINRAERGVGLNRNNALKNATSDLCVLADDDMVFYDNYVEIVEEAFKKNKKADFLIFNIDEKQGFFILLLLGLFLWGLLLELLFCPLKDTSKKSS